MTVALLVFWACAAGLLLTWLIYPGFVMLVGLWPWRETSASNGKISFLSFIIAAFNEGSRIGERINNLMTLRCDWPFEILVGSDGSTDDTVEVVTSMKYAEVKVLAFQKNRGRASVHNACAMDAKGDILIFTDAETVFKKDFLEQIIPHFADPRVGTVSGRILYLNKDESSISRSADLYWRFEEYIRLGESRLGILGFGTGAALAMRKDAYSAMGPTEDIDYSATLRASGKGYKVLYEPHAVAYDRISVTPGGALKTRIRQTSRCFKSVLKLIFSAQILFRRPVVFAATLIHKTFRHLTPFFMLGLLFSNLYLLSANTFYGGLFVLQMVFYALAAMGYFRSRFSARWWRWLTILPYNFLLLNIGRGIGVIMALAGRDPSTYETTL
jgi:cellulose synthase/poly-beta-1,6-N-acetylglucosamine synthase-like glycosyltransferase